MKIKHCLFAFCLVSAILPAMALGADMNLMNKGEGGGGKAAKPRSQIMKTSPVHIDIETGTINLLFTADLSRVNLRLQDATGFAAVDQQVDTSAHSEVSFYLPAGTYTLTITTADESMITQMHVVIP